MRIICVFLLSAAGAFAADQKESVDFKVTAEAFSKESGDQKAFNAKYGGKVVEITEVEQNRDSNRSLLQKPRAAF